MGEGPKDPIAVLIGEGPGRDEAEEGRPFVGMTGMELDAALLKYGLLRNKLFILNATCCQPPHNKTEPQMKKAVLCCRGAFRAQMKKLDPKLPAVAMGKWAGFALTGRDRGTGNSRGFLQEAEGRPLIMSWHPTYAFFRNPYEAGAFEVDLDRFARLVRDELQPPPSALITDPTVEDIRRVVEDGWVAVDIETSPARGDEDGHTGKNPTRARLRSIGLGNQRWGLAYYYRDRNAAVEKAIAEVLGDPNIMKVGHNFLWFDRRVLRRYGLKVKNLVDTRDMRRALSATSRLSLAYVTSLYADMTNWKEESDGK